MIIFRKIAKDVLKYILSTDDFSEFDDNKNDGYPICLNFTLLNESSYYSPKDDRGLPYRIYSSVGGQYNPTRMAAYALANYNNFLLFGNEQNKINFFKCVQWFSDKENARYEYAFDWGDLKAPWISCMSQGEAASVLIRAYRLSGDEQYLKHAELSLEPMFSLVKDGGVQSVLSDGASFLEEYPTENSTHVLNGFMYAVIGLGEYVDETDSQRHRNLFLQLAFSISKNIDKWSYGSWSLYEDRLKANGLNFCTPSYHNLQITQLKWLNRRVPNPDLERVILLWQEGRDSFWVRMFALLGKIHFRFLHKAIR